MSLTKVDPEALSLLEPLHVLVIQLFGDLLKEEKEKKGQPKSFSNSVNKLV